MESRSARYLMCFIGLAAGSFVWAWLSEGDYGQAAHDSYFQGMALFALWLLDQIDRWRL